MIDLPEIDVWHSKPLDVHVWSEHPEINKVVDAVYDGLTDDGRLQISGKSNNAGKASGKVILKLVLIDLYVGSLLQLDPKGSNNTGLLLT
jgi:hypothetical protein